MKFKKYIAPILCFILLIVSVVGLSMFDTAVSETQSDESAIIDSSFLEDNVLPMGVIDEMGLNEDKSIYDNDDEDSIVYFYVTVRYGNEGKGTNHTFSEVNNVTRFADGAHVDNDVYAEALVQIGDENGPSYGMVGFGQTKSNATIRVRGNSSTAGRQKSYQLMLDDDAGTWRGQSNIALNKHIYDSTRFRNKLYFDLLRDVEDMASLRTQFVRLFIKDETSGQAKYEDYGLYTQVEVPNKKYLKNHGLDGNGYLYKAISFDFSKNDYIKNFDDPEFNLENFETVFTAKGEQDNTRLIELVEVVESASDGSTLIDEYFDRDNYLTWLAYNILMGNIDTTSQNFYLYSPLNGSKWYFIPWDSDGSLRKLESSLDKHWQHGVQNYWHVPLHRKMLMVEDIRNDLCEKVDELYKYLSKERVNGYIDMYRTTIDAYVTSMPDIQHLNQTVEDRNDIIGSMYTELEDNYYLFYQSLEEIMPFFFYEAVRVEKGVTFSWEYPYDFKNHEIYFDISISKYPDMRNAITGEKLRVSMFTVENLESGTYYVSVRAYDDSGRMTKLYNSITVNGVLYDGVAEVVVE